MRRLILMVFLAALTGCFSTQDASAELEIPESEAACVEAGGRWAAGGILQRPLCFLPTPDAGESCAKADDCTGFCLSETRTCSPETPRFGCFGLLDLDGKEATLCVD